MMLYIEGSHYRIHHFYYNDIGINVLLFGCFAGVMHCVELCSMSVVLARVPVGNRSLQSTGDQSCAPMGNYQDETPSVSQDFAGN